MDPIATIDTISTLVTDVEYISSKVSRRKYYFNKFCRRTIKVLVYGDSGVGKTQFLNTLTGNNSYSPGRTRFVQKYSLTLSSGRKVLFLDTPGHQTTEMVRKKTLDDITKGKIDGIINLVNYGYQDSEELQNDPDKAFNVDTNEVKPSFLRDNMKREISRTVEFIERFNSSSKVDWIFTVINKADIWYANKQEVYDYYSNGEYAIRISELTRSTDLFTIPFCSVITPFANKEMKLIYGERDKKNMYDILTSHLDYVCNR